MFIINTDNYGVNLQKEDRISKGKRRLASKNGCMMDLKKELPLMFKAFYDAVELYEKEIVQTPPEARARGFGAILLSSKIAQCMQKYFPHNWKWGKYRRFSIRINGYIILFKKLDKYGKPMNIKTKSVESIAGQRQLSLFNESSYVAEPILFFGYLTDKLGEIVDPQLVYIDDDKVQFTIEENQITKIKQIDISTKERRELTLKLKRAKKRRKTS